MRIPAINWFDVALVMIMVCSAAEGMRSGLARVVVGLAATLAGLFAGVWFYRLVGAKLAPWVHSETLADTLGFLLIFSVALVLGGMLAALLARIFEWFGLSWFNHFLGGVAGFVRGVLVVGVLVEMTVAFSPSPTPRVLENSRVLPYASELAGWLADLAPSQLRDAFTELLENLKRHWTKPRNQDDKDHGQVV